MEKLPISIGILSWHSGQVLVDTLTTYHNNGLFDMVNDVTILFQEVTQQDMEIATHFGLDFIGLQLTSDVKRTIAEMKEPENHPVTIERKGKGKGLLVDSGRLTNAISYEVV